MCPGSGEGGCAFFSQLPAHPRGHVTNLGHAEPVSRAGPVRILAAMSQPYEQEFRARWVDMDLNQHMRNAAYLGCSEETRMRYLDVHGFTMAEFSKRQLGPVVVEDRIVYRRELGLLETFRVDLALASGGDRRFEKAESTQPLRAWGR